MIHIQLPCYTLSRPVQNPLWGTCRGPRGYFFYIHKIPYSLHYDPVWNSHLRVEASIIVFDYVYYLFFVYISQNKYRIGVLLVVLVLLEGEMNTVEQFNLPMHVPQVADDLVLLAHALVEVLIPVHLIDGLQFKGQLDEAPYELRGLMHVIAQVALSHEYFDLDYNRAISLYIA